MFKFFYRSRKPSKHKATPPQACLSDIRTWKVTGNSTFLQKAVNAGLDTSVQVDEQLGNALHVSAQHSYLESLFVLHATGIRDVTKNPQEQYAVHLAAAAGFRDGALYLLKNMGADIDARNGKGATPLILAIENDRLDVASALLARGATVDRPNSFVGEAHPTSGDGIHAAIHMCKSPAMLRLLLTTTTLHVDTRSTEGQTLLHMCSAHGDTATAAEAIALGASVNAVDNKKYNALHHACRHGASHIIPLLIKAGCSASDPDSKGFTPVEVTLLRHDCDIAYALYCAGALFTKRQLLLLSILLRHSSLLRAIRKERDLANVVGETLLPEIEQPSTKVETQAAALLAGPPDTHINPSSPTSLSLASLVVSVGNVPTNYDVNADNLHDTFQNLHDPVPRPVGTDSSAVLVSVYSRFLRHSDSASGAVPKWQSGRVGRGPGMIDENQKYDLNAQPVPHRYSESGVDKDQRKKGFWTSTDGHPPGGPVAAGTNKDYQLWDVAAERQEAADRLDAVNSAAGRSSLERLLPHYLVGLSQYMRKAPTPTPLTETTLSPSPSQMKASSSSATPAQTNNAAQNLESVSSFAPVSLVRSGSTQKPPPPQALGSFAPVQPVRPVHTQPPSQSMHHVYPNVAPPRSLNVRKIDGAQRAQQGRAPPRRSFCGEAPPEAAAIAAAANNAAEREDFQRGHRGTNVRKSSFFSRGKTEPTQNGPVAMNRRSRTFDLGYRHSELVGVPASRGPWGQPKVIPGPGGALRNPQARSNAMRTSQDDMVLMNEGRELPPSGQDLAADGMLEFEEMMARRVRMFEGGVRQPGDSRASVSLAEQARPINPRTTARMQGQGQQSVNQNNTLQQQQQQRQEFAGASRGSPSS